jgi:hypothetical protein
MHAVLAVRAGLLSERRKNEEIDHELLLFIVFVFIQNSNSFENRCSTFHI